MTNKLLEFIQDVPFDAAVPDVAVIVDRAGGHLLHLWPGQVVQLLAQEEWVCHLHLPMGGQARAFIDQITFIIFLRTHVYQATLAFWAK